MMALEDQKEYKKNLYFLSKAILLYRGQCPFHYALTLHSLSPLKKLIQQKYICENDCPFGEIPCNMNIPGKQKRMLDLASEILDSYSEEDLLEILL